MPGWHAVKREGIRGVDVVEHGQAGQQTRRQQGHELGAALSHDDIRAKRLDDRSHLRRRIVRPPRWISQTVVDVAFGPKYFPGQTGANPGQANSGQPAQHAGGRATLDDGSAEFMRIDFHAAVKFGKMFVGCHEQNAHRGGTPGSRLRPATRKVTDSRLHPWRRLAAVPVSKLRKSPESTSAEERMDGEPGRSGLVCLRRRLSFPHASCV